MTPRHLRRLFRQHAGASPTAVALTRRVQRAKTLVDGTAMPMSAIAFAAGFASIRRFNAAFRAVYRRPPSTLRRARRRPDAARGRHLG
jgi:AraC family transcriptional regulator of adaptative response / DNA-3-methyladenine glycosylase II